MCVSGECGAEDCWGRLAEPPKRSPGSEDVCRVPELDFLDDGGLPASRPDGVALAGLNVDPDEQNTANVPNVPADPGADI